MNQINAVTLALKALRHKPLSTTLNLLLMAIGIGMMTFVLSAASQLEDTATRDADGIDLVVGAKGSPLQLIMSSIFHIDIPTGNIPLSAQAELQANPMVLQVIPLALGDSFQGFRIVGTSHDYIDHYGGQLAQGQLYAQPMEAVFGAQAASAAGAVVGASFAGSHGLAMGGEEHKHAPYKVVGILKPTGTVLDRLVLTSVASVWRVHETDPDEAPAVHDDADRELTALLVRYASPLAVVSLPRWVNQQARLQAAQPALEAAKLFRIVGAGAEVLRAIAAGVLLVAALSMFVALYNALEERRTDLAILRTLGAPPGKLFRQMLAQGLLLAMGGAALGWVLGHVGIAILSRMLAADQNLSLAPWTIDPSEVWLLLVTLAVGLLASVIPAVRAYRTDIAQTLAR